MKTSNFQNLTRTTTLAYSTQKLDLIYETALHLLSKEAAPNRKFRLIGIGLGKLKESAEKKLKEYNKIIENSKQEAKKIIEDGRKRLNQDIENKKKDFNNQIEKEIAVIEKEIKDLKKTSLSNISKIASETSAELMKKIINTEVNKSNVSAVVDDIIKINIGKLT